MKKLILAIAVIVVTGAFEQRAAVITARQSKATAETIISRLDTLGIKVDRLNLASPKITSYEK